MLGLALSQWSGPAEYQAFTSSLKSMPLDQLHCEFDRRWDLRKGLEAQRTALKKDPGYTWKAQNLAISRLNTEMSEINGERRRKGAATTDPGQCAAAAPVPRPTPFTFEMPALPPAEYQIPKIDLPPMPDLSAEYDELRKLEEELVALQSQRVGPPPAPTGIQYGTSRGEPVVALQARPIATLAPEEIGFEPAGIVDVSEMVPSAPVPAPAPVTTTTVTAEVKKEGINPLWLALGAGALILLMRGKKKKKKR